MEKKTENSPKSGINWTFFLKITESKAANVPVLLSHAIQSVRKQLEGKLMVFFSYGDAVFDVCSASSWMSFHSVAAMRIKQIPPLSVRLNFEKVHRLSSVCWVFLVSSEGNCSL